MATDNIILLSDSYKVSHAQQYQPGTTEVYSYFESRGGRFPEIVFFGLQYYLKRYLSRPITQEDIDEADSYFGPHFQNPALFNRAGWQYILEKHGGRLPISIKAVPEGTPVPFKNVMMTVENTDPNCFWLTNYLETILSNIWYPCTVATLSREQKSHLKLYLSRTSDSLEGLPFKLHDFGCRGVSCPEQAAIGGAAHLVNFMGTDTLPALVLARKYYGAEMAGASIPASEHSTITSWGRENEVEAMRNMLVQYPTGPVACVSDSYDIYHACRTLWGETLRDLIMSRENGFLVIRPDSGDPLEVLPKVLNILAEQFGSTTNSLGFKMLPPQLRVIQGDGIDIDSLTGILDTITEAGFSTDNLAFGSGGGLLQKVNRDTCKFAFKCCSTTVNGEQIDVYKQPVDAPWKISKKGKLKLIRTPTGFQTVSSSDNQALYEKAEDQMVEVYRDGKILVDYTFDQIRKLAEV